MYKMLLAVTLLALFLPAVAAPNNEPVTIRVGSKTFTESVILGEMLRHLASSAGHRAYHRRELGGTRVLWDALLAGEIDAYPEYTGTLMQEILVNEGLRTDAALQRALAKRGLRMTRPLGFNNTYAIGVKTELADRLHLKTISDLKKYPELRMGFSNEFMERADGWPGLKRRYHLPQQNVRGLDHDLAYRGIQSGKLDVTDLYATDAEIAYYKLRTLQDDLHYFPVYNAVILYRADLERRAPDVAALFKRLEGKIDESAMSAMNARVKLDGEPETVVAADFLDKTLGIRTETRIQTAWQRFRHNTRDHLVLVAISLSAAILIAIPLGIAAARLPRFGQIILATVGIIQTIPSLALFVFMIPLLGIGGPPAMVALFLYSLLPIVRNTHAGLSDIPLAIRESAEALGLPRGAQLRLIELPFHPGRHQDLGGHKCWHGHPGGTHRRRRLRAANPDRYPARRYRPHPPGRGAGSGAGAAGTGIVRAGGAMDAAQGLEVEHSAKDVISGTQ